jgi:hypothetical protein
MLTLICLFVALAIGVAVGAYSHKYLAKVTGAPSNLTVASAPGAVAALVDHGVSVAHEAIDDAAAQAKATVAK